MFLVNCGMIKKRPKRFTASPKSSYIYPIGTKSHCLVTRSKRQEARAKSQEPRATQTKTQTQTHTQRHVCTQLRNTSKAERTETDTQTLSYKVVPRGLEPRTLRLLSVRSNQLSYETDDRAAMKTRKKII